SSDIISLTRQSWHWASVPIHGQDPGYQQATGDLRDFDAVDRVETNRWFIPKDRVLRRYLNPDLVESERNETQHAMNLFLRAEDGIWDPEDWGGIMRGISRAGLDLSESQFLEFWINDGVPDRDQRSGKLHIDFGFIDEDFYWDFPEGLVTGTFDDEDTNGDGIFVAAEDIGLDTVQDRRIYDAAFNDYGDPYPGINYTETNNLRDSEDLNANTRFDRSNGFFTMTVDLKETEPLADVVYDYDDVADLVENNISWRKYRIPIGAMLDIGIDRAPDLAAVTHVRIWFEDDNANARTQVQLQLSELKFLGSRWEREGIRKQSDETLLAPGELLPYESFFIGEVNNKENPDYIPPFPVYEENNIPEKEQSLSLNFVDIDRDHLVRISKQISPRGDDYTRYEELSWYWYNPRHDLADVDLFFRVGSDTLNYYETRYRFAEGIDKIGWQRLTVDIAELSNVKNQEPDSTGFVLLTDSRTGQQLRTRVVGRPDLRSVKRYYFGIVNNQLTTPTTGYFWMNDVMLLGVKRDIGFAERVALRLNMADVLKVDFDWSR
ncbi:MAG: hypothetical protein KAJ37_07155, partial [Candidatus Krumholzibacteria bacterium]|nr:hypothetical protein [Candidatus Krumholzibacteria bacterium]